MRRGPNPRMVAVLAFLAVVLGGGAIYLQYNAKEEAQAEVVALQAEIPDEAQLNADLQAAQLAVRQGRQRLAHLESAVPQTAYIPTLLKEIEGLGIASQREVTGVRPVPAMSQPADPSAPVEEKPYNEIEIDLTTRGEYSAVQAMLEGLKRFPKIIGVRTLEITPQMRERSTTYDYLNVTFRVRAFVFPPKASDAPSEEDLKRMSAEPQAQPAKTATAPEPEGA